MAKMTPERRAEVAKIILQHISYSAPFPCHAKRLIYEYRYEQNEGRAALAYLLKTGEVVKVGRGRYKRADNERTA